MSTLRRWLHPPPAEDPEETLRSRINHWIVGGLLIFVALHTGRVTVFIDSADCDEASLEFLEEPFMQDALIARIDELFGDSFRG